MKKIKTIALILLVLILLALPTLVRWKWYYRGVYRPPAMAVEPSEQSDILPLSYQSHQDTPIDGSGHIIIDMAHSNNLAVGDLAPLQSKLMARGVSTEIYDGLNIPLEELLIGASGLVVAVPNFNFYPSEKQAIEAFVADGGRLLLAADPARVDPYTFESTTSVINNLATAFGIVYTDDYLYNLQENEGNYRNVRFTDFEPEQSLTQNLKTVVFFAAHSLLTKGTALAVSDANTFSSLRNGEDKFSPWVLSADEHVLAIGDVTVLTAPYHTVADNDQLLGNIANWLAVDSRLRTLEDFPYGYTRPIDLVQVGGDLINPQIIANIGALQNTFEQTHLSLTISDRIDSAHDGLLVGTFDNLSGVEDYLSTAGITVTIPLTTEASLSPTLESEAELPNNLLSGIIEIEGVGSIGTTGTTLFLIDQRPNRRVVIALAENSEGVVGALNRLAQHNFQGCVSASALILCSTGEFQDGSDHLLVPELPETGEKPQVFIFSNDARSSGGRNNAEDLQWMLEGIADVTMWSAAKDGSPTAADLNGYQILIIDSGDTAVDATEQEPFLDFASSIPDTLKIMILIGAQPFYMPDAEFAPLDDLIVTDSLHPLTAGIDVGEVIPLLPSESGVPALVFPADMVTNIETEGAILMSRGPNSEQTGAPVILVQNDEVTGVSVIFVACALYRLPGDVQELLMENTMQWLAETW